MNRLPTPDEVPEPLAALMREHEHVAGLLTHARATFDGATVDDAGGVLRG